MPAVPRASPEKPAGAEAAEYRATAPPRASDPNRVEQGPCWISTRSMPARSMALALTPPSPDTSVSRRPSRVTTVSWARAPPRKMVAAVPTPPALNTWPGSWSWSSSVRFVAPRRWMVSWSITCTGFGVWSRATGRASAVTVTVAEASASGRGAPESRAASAAPRRLAPRARRMVIRVLPMSCSAHEAGGGGAAPGQGSRPAPTAGLGNAGPVSGLARDRHLAVPPGPSRGCAPVGPARSPGSRNHSGGCRRGAGVHTVAGQRRNHTCFPNIQHTM